MSVFAKLFEIIELAEKHTSQVFVFPITTTKTVLFVILGKAPLDSRGLFLCTMFSGNL